MAEAPLRHRNYRVMRISSCGVEDAADRLYGDDAGLRCASYEEQLRSWLERKIGCNEAFSRAMKSRGHEIREVLFDLEPVQRTWAWERGLDLDERDWKAQILLEQIRDFRPEVLYLEGYDALPASLRVSIRKRVPSIELIVVHQGACEGTASVLRELRRADVLFVSSPALLLACREAGLEPHLVYEAFDPSVLCELPAPSKLDPATLSDATFLGTTGENAGRKKREQWITKLLDADLVDVYPRELTASGRQRKRGGFASRSSKRLFEPLFGFDYFARLQASRISLNYHCDAAGGFVGNRRMFEATGVGSCLLTDRGSNLDELFEDGREVVTFDGVADAKEKIRYLLEHEDERKAIADAGRARTLGEHTVQKRVAVIDEWIQLGLAARRKATRTRWRGLPGSMPAG